MIPKNRWPSPGNLIAIAIAVYLAVSLISVIRHNVQLNHQIASLQQQVQTLQDQKDELNYKLQYYQTDAYKEKEARAELDLQAPGEGVIILPKQSTADSQQTKSAPTKSNSQQWKEFLFGTS